MPERPPALDNGYVWMMNALLPAAKSRLLIQQLSDLRHELRTRDYSAMDDPDHDTGVELWVHPDDQGRAGNILDRLLADG